MCACRLSCVLAYIMLPISTDSEVEDTGSRVFDQRIGLEFSAGEVQLWQEHRPPRHTGHDSTVGDGRENNMSILQWIEFKIFTTLSLDTSFRLRTNHPGAATYPKTISKRPNVG